ncbi:hypothetical protein [Flavobacterium sp.]|uniref:hypothetical protein n=1 Tax=Flavobacterium sp. TaxID=239 RepID=UPI002BADABDD|nr:hypothetical protein [Flavobacterium sp.]HSD07640.1 hypothetical protein [Flavobacterium sp.]
MEENTQKEIVADDWLVTGERYVAFIDIMGFKDMVLKKSHNEIYDMMLKINQKKKTSENIDWEFVNEKLVRTTTYSDSIMIYSKDDTLNSLKSIIYTVANLSFGLFTEGIPFKGAMSFGMMTLDIENSIFFGQPLIDAYLLQEELNYYGIIVHATAELKVYELNGDPVPFSTHYFCPLKNGMSKHLTIFPMFADPKSNTEPEHVKTHDYLIKSISDLRYMTSGHLRKYIDSTESYLEYIKNK